MKTFIAVLASAFCMATHAAPPPAPAINVAATDVRQLEFNWEPVPGVQTYELWFRSSVGAAWVKYAERDARRAPMFRIGVPVHLLNWDAANYLVKACNNTGCASSNVVGVADERLPAIGFVKPRATSGVRFFGNKVALSADGNTIAVTASEIIGDARDTLVVHVYRKTTSSSGWRLEARLRPSVLQWYTAQQFQGDNLALSADGNVLAVGSIFEARAEAQVIDAVGAVYVFRRSGTTWTQSQALRVNGEERDQFGYFVKMDEAASTLVISRNYPNFSGTLEVYRRPAGGDQFVHDMSLPAPTHPNGTSVCAGLGLSGDGNTLARGCSGAAGNFTYVHSGPAFAQIALLPLSPNYGFDLNYDGSVLLSQDQPGAHVYRLSAGVWQSEGLLANGGNMRFIDGVTQIAISRDGKIAAIGNQREQSVGLGPTDPPFVAGDPTNYNGGVMIYQHKPSGWQLRRLVKPGSANFGFAGYSVALSGNGNLLAVGAPLDPSAAAGIDGDRDDASAPERGAVWLY